MPDPRQSRLNEIETQIAREEAEDAASPVGAERPEILTFDGFAEAGGTTRRGTTDHRRKRRGRR